MSLETTPQSVKSSSAESSGEEIGGCAIVNPTLHAPHLRAAFHALSRAFAEPFSIVDVENGEIVYAESESLRCDLSGRLGLLAEISRSGKPEIIEDVSPLLMLAIPLRSLHVCAPLVAVGVFTYERVEGKQQMAAASHAFGIDTERALNWAASRTLWPARALLQLGETVIQNLAQEHQIKRLHREINDAVRHARDTYIELALLHRLTRHLQLSESEAELWKNALTWLADAVQAQGLALVSHQSTDEDSQHFQIDDPSGVLTQGECPAEKADLQRLIIQLGSKIHENSLVLNRAETSLPTWGFPEIRELVCVPVKVGTHLLGWLLALNHKGAAGDEFSKFGSVEIRLLSSVGTILGIHISNVDLYQQQAELFSGAIQALSSTIDAKDRYTSGHSDRVARVSATLADTLGLDRPTQELIHLAGLLHDIGKIGIDDQVLNKPGALTDEEYEHVKQHPQLGYDILKGVRPLEKILPIVLHHHEAWNGQGYPSGLKGKETPQVARIVAVADAFDAMSSDRPYRKGMKDEKLDTIFREGAGSQWDPEVIDAFFAIRDKIRKISKAHPDQSIGPNLVPGH